MTSSQNIQESRQISGVQGAGDTLSLERKQVCRIGRHHVQVTVAVQIQQPHPVVAHLGRSHRRAGQQIPVQPLERVLETQEFDLLAVLTGRIID